MVYICQAPNVPGKFDAEKAKSLRVPNGKQRAELVRGQPIEFDDPDNPGQKKVVRPEEVIGPSTKGAVSRVGPHDGNQLTGSTLPWSAALPRLCLIFYALRLSLRFSRKGKKAQTKR